MLSHMADLVLGPRMDAPPELPPALVPAGVVLRQGRLLPALGGFFARMRGPAAAVTLGRTIVVHPGVLLTRRLLVHELAHVRQWDEDLLFPLRYAIESLRHGYTENRYERQAREAERGEG
jgi:hypothetical protein